MNEKEILRKKKNLEEIRMLRESKLKLLAKAGANLGSAPATEGQSTPTPPPASSLGVVPEEESAPPPFGSNGPTSLPSSSSVRASAEVLPTVNRTPHHVDGTIHCGEGEAVPSSSEHLLSPSFLPLSCATVGSPASIIPPVQEEGKEMVVVVPRNGLDMLRAWDALDTSESASPADRRSRKTMEGEDGMSKHSFPPSSAPLGSDSSPLGQAPFTPVNEYGPSCCFASSSHAVAELNSAFLFKGESSAYIFSALPPVSDLSIGTIPCNFRVGGGATGRVDLHGTLVEVHGSGWNDTGERMDSALLERSLQEKPVGVVMAASFTTAARFSEEEDDEIRESTMDRKGDEKKFLFSKGVGMLGGDGSRNDRSTSHTGVAWGSSRGAGAEWTATSTSGQDKMKFGSELDHFLILNSPGLVLVWVLLPTVHAELRHRMQQHNLHKPTASDGTQESTTTPAKKDAVESTYLFSVSDIVAVVPLVCDADVRTILLHPTQPGVLLGGTRSGRVVWWNFASSWSNWTLPQFISRAVASSGAPHTLLLPCQRPSYSSFPSPGGGILRLAVLGESGDHRICAVREDGGIRTWSAPPLLMPRSVLEPFYGDKPLHCHATSASIIVTSNSSIVKVFLGTSTGAVFIGHFRDSDDKSICYVSSSSENSNSPADLFPPLFSSPSPSLPCSPLENASHMGLVTSISCQRSKDEPQIPLEASRLCQGSNSSIAYAKQNNFGYSRRLSCAAISPAIRKENGAFISCGIHGESFLWSNDRSTPPLSLSTNATTAVCWAPGNPTLFATGSSGGAIFLYSAADVARYVTMVPSKSFENHQLSFALLQILPKHGFPHSFVHMKIPELSARTGATGAASASGSDKSFSPVTALEFSPDGNWLFAGYDTGCVMIFRLHHEGKAKKNTKMTGVRLIPSSQIAPHFSVHSASFSPVTSMKGRTNFLEAQCYGAMRMYSRMFTTTSPHFSSLPAGGMSNTSSTSLFPWDNSLRLQGVVTAFKHRRGYGFVLAEGYTKASAELLKQQREAMSQEGGDSEALETNRQAKKSGASPHVGMPKPKSNDFFFTRVALGGGFFVREGDRVSFRVKPLSEKDGESKRLRHSYVSRGESLSITGERADSEDADGREGCFRKGGHSFTAIGLRHYNPETGKESRILPVAICGVVTQWDPSTGIGIISELDVDGKLHVEDAPKFEVRLENIDISPVPDSSDSFLQEGRYVKFCTSIPSSSNEASPTASSRRSSSTGEDLQRSPSTSSNPLSQAYRVIIDIGTERRNGVVTTRPSERAGASHTRQRPSSSSFGLLADQRGVIREIVERKYAFVVDDASGESIFFHFSEMLEPLSAQNFPRIGDSVVYDTELIPTGRHAGKRHCVRARILREESVIPALGVDLHSQVGEPTIPPSTSSTAISTSEKKNKKNSKTTSGTPKSLLEEFDLLD